MKTNSTLLMFVWFFLLLFFLHVFASQKIVNFCSVFMFAIFQNRYIVSNFHNLKLFCTKKHHWCISKKLFHLEPETAFLAQKTLELIQRKQKKVFETFFSNVSIGILSRSFCYVFCSIAFFFGQKKCFSTKKACSLFF
jgi:hypothetical protein